MDKNAQYFFYCFHTVPKTNLWKLFLRKKRKTSPLPSASSSSPFFFFEIMDFGLFLPIIQGMISEKMQEGPEQPLLFGLGQEGRAVPPGILSTEVQRPLSRPATMCKFKKNNFNVKLQLVAL